MATTKKYLSLDRLNDYDALIKSKVDSGDASTLSSAKSYTDTEVAKKANVTHNHDSAYDAKGSASAAQTAAQSYTDTKISGLTSGTTTVKNAEHATTADSATTAASCTGNAATATKATQDGNGKVISEQYETKADATAKLNSAKAYADSAATQVKNDLLNGAGTAYDTLKELGDLIDTNVDAIDALEVVAAGKADKTHTHSNYASTVTTTGTGNAITAIAQSGNTITATKGSTFLTAHPTITTSSDTTTTASPTFGGTFTAVDSITKDSNGHVAKINTKTVAVPSAAASTSAAGLMTSTMVTKLNGIATGATKVTVDTALSASSTNPVQNKVINTALVNLTDATNLNTQTITGHTTSINNLQAEVDSWEEITAAEIQSLFQQ